MKMGTYMMLLLSLTILCTADDEKVTPFGEYKCATELSDKYCGGGLFPLDKSGKSDAALCSYECSEVVYGDPLIDCILKEDYWRKNIDKDLITLLGNLEGHCITPIATESESSLEDYYLDLDIEAELPASEEAEEDLSLFLENF